MGGIKKNQVLLFAFAAVCLSVVLSAGSTGSSFIILHGAGCLFAGVIAGKGAGAPRERRQALLARAGRGKVFLPDLTRALDDENLLVRRTAARLLLEMGGGGRPALEAAFKNADAIVRMSALRGLMKSGVAGSEHIRLALEDEDALVRREAVRLLCSMKHGIENAEELLKVAANDGATLVREAALNAIWNKGEVLPPLRLTVDHDVEEIVSVKLPSEGWKFKMDPEGAGWDWFLSGYDDSDWENIGIEKPWDDFGHDYKGIAWYRGYFDTVAEVECDSVEVSFQGVSESCWVWINENYVGSHDIGPVGHKVPFELNITDSVEWSKRNHITVRAYNTLHPGGIWKPVFVKALSEMIP